MKSRLSLSPDVAFTVRPKVVVAIVTMGIVLGTAGWRSAAWVLTHVDRVAHAVQDSTFTPHIQAEEQHHQLQDSAIAAIARETQASRREQNALTCHVYNYPRPFCDDLRPRGAQAGRPR